ncbi:hypothetical protein M404DRAFT_996418 [Pisolithus tinctorius Marx 270]|uniref:Uncharacterized protein n=1 Tax=Pisolithus tinctorius Marx 270 TaxID=870435 RepID=A0A0C3PLH8_PISTI|nr:hypothetical protein M404DRAFT_996418 [Pisolithus tinctorius Marx 270]
MAKGVHYHLVTYMRRLPKLHSRKTELGISDSRAKRGAEKVRTVFVKGIGFPWQEIDRLIHRQQRTRRKGGCVSSIVLRG